jgi:hypothetical protein
MPADRTSTTKPDLAPRATRLKLKKTGPRRELTIDEVNFSLLPPALQIRRRHFPRELRPRTDKPAPSRDSPPTLPLRYRPAPKFIKATLSSSTPTLSGKKSNSTTTIAGTSQTEKIPDATPHLSTSQEQHDALYSTLKARSNQLSL